MAKKEKTVKVKRVKGKGYNIIIDDSLNKYKDVVLFPEKLEKANEMLKKTGIPKELQKNKTNKIKHK
ncbi:MAG: hypothetical protein WC223_10695 [Bacteroidales bacterium]|jgi:hypothetical protein